MTRIRANIDRFPARRGTADQRRDLRPAQLVVHTGIPPNDGQVGWKGVTRKLGLDIRGKEQAFARSDR
jgi:hypothetical protein